MKDREPRPQLRPRIDFEQVRAWLEANARFYQDDELAMLTPLPDAATAEAGRQWPRGYIVEDEPEAFTRSSAHASGTAIDFVAFDEAFQRAIVPLSNVATAAWNNVRPLMEAVAAATGHEEPPADPKARALWLRQHRNTGPQQYLLDGRRRR